MDHHQLDAFLVLARELHFGRTAECMQLSQSRVSRLIAALERDIGATLFERTSRRVRLTPLGAALYQDLHPADQQVRRAVEHARTAARSPTGALRLGFTVTTEGEALNRLVRAFETRHPDSELILREVSIFDDHETLRSGEIDVLFNWLTVDEPDLTIGPALDHEDRVVAVAAEHPLARRATVSVDDLADYEAALFLPSLPPALVDAIVPPLSPAGRVIARTRPVRTMAETWALVARGHIVHPTVASMSRHLTRSDIVLVSITDLPPLPLGLIWCTTHENARIRALSLVASSLGAHAGQAHGGSKPPT